MYRRPRERLATTGVQAAPSSRWQLRARYRETISGEERFANEMARPAQIVQQRKDALNGSDRLAQLDREIAAHRDVLATLSDDFYAAIDRAIDEGRPECAAVDELLDRREQTQIEIDMLGERRYRLVVVTGIAEASGVSRDDLVRERDAAAAECRRVQRLIRLWDREVALGRRAVDGTTFVVMAGGRDVPVELHAVAPDAVDPEEPPGSLVVASPAAPHGPPALRVGVAA